MPLVDLRGFHDNAFDARWYPKRRKGRGGGAPIPEDLRFAAPRSRVFNISAINGGGAVTWYGFPRCIGPGIIKRIQIWNMNANDPVGVTLEIGVSYAPLASGFQALTLARPYEVLTEMHPDSNRIAATAGDGIPFGTVPGGTDRQSLQVDLIITQPEFYPVLGLVNSTGGNHGWDVQLTVLEAVNPEALRFFL